LRPRPVTVADADEARDIERQLTALLERAARLSRDFASFQVTDAAVQLRIARDAMSIVTDQLDMTVTPPIVVIHEEEP
jgi:aminoglycoside N3'-acetyltransferase